MHIPDNYLSPATCAVMTAAMVPVWTKAVRRVNLEIPKTKLPMLGVGAAFSFLMMMFNVPLPGGTTGHAVGGTLIAILLGPYAACISVTVALFIQALMFGDGGILAFGANCFNMAFVLPFVGYYVYVGFKKGIKAKGASQIGMVLGAYLGINIAALVAAVEFGLQPLLFTNKLGQPLYCPYPLSVSIPAMLIPHLLVAGVVEAIFTLAIITYLQKVSPEMLYSNSTKQLSGAYGLIIGLICLSPLGLLAAGTAWGEWGSDEISSVMSGGKALGYVPEGMTKGLNYQALMPDYALAGVPESVGYILSAVAGVAILIIVFKLMSAFKKDKVGDLIGK